MIETGPDLWLAAGCTDRQFAVLELRESHGFSWQVIADDLDLSISTVRTHHKAGARRVHRYLSQRKKAA